jgi:hypothetical protein
MEGFSNQLFLSFSYEGVPKLTLNIKNLILFQKTMTKRLFLGASLALARSLRFAPAERTRKSQT